MMPAFTGRNAMSRAVDRQFPEPSERHWVVWKVPIMVNLLHYLRTGEIML